MYPVAVIKNYGNCVSPAATAAITLNVISEKGPREEIQPRDLFWVVFRSFLLFVMRPKRYFGAKSLASV